MSFGSLVVATGLTTLTTWFWYRMYLYFRGKYDFEGEFTTRVVAAIHAIVCVIFAFLSLRSGPDPLTEPGEANTYFQTAGMIISLGYFIYDFIWCVKFQPEIKIILAHHLGSIFSLGFIICCGYSGAEAIGGLGSMEITNPLLQARWFLRTYNKKDTVLYQVVEYTFFALFLSVRLGYGSYLVYSVVLSGKTFIVVKLCTLCMYTISLAFIYTIICFVVKKIKGRQNCDDDDDVNLS